MLNEELQIFSHGTMSGQVVWLNLRRESNSIELCLSLPSQEIFIFVLVLEDTDDLEQVLTDGRYPTDLTSILGELLSNPLDHWRKRILILCWNFLLPNPCIIIVNIFYKCTIEFVKLFPEFADWRFSSLSVDLTELLDRLILHEEVVFSTIHFMCLHDSRGIPVLFWSVEVYEPAHIPCLSNVLRPYILILILFFISYFDNIFFVIILLFKFHALFHGLLLSVLITRFRCDLGL